MKFISVKYIRSGQKLFPVHSTFLDVVSLPVAQLHCLSHPLDLFIQQTVPFVQLRTFFQTLFAHKFEQLPQVINLSY